MTNDPKNPEYNAKARDAIMDLCPFYDPNHKCGIVREKVFKDCLAELRERHRITLEKLAKWESVAAEILPPGSDAGESGVPEMFFDSFEELKKEKAWLIEKGEKLVRWVEGPRHSHEEVRDHNGRLKDTGIWAQFYVAVRGIQRKDTPKPSGQNASDQATASK